MGIKCSNQSKKIKSINNGQQNQIKQQNSQEQNISECECLIWDEINSRFFPKVIQMSLNNKNETQYILDGQILRINDKNEFSPSLLQMANLEQIKYLKWVKKIGFNPQNLKKTIAMWNGEILFETGGFYSLKSQQMFMETTHPKLLDVRYSLFIIINSKAKVYEIGEYQNNLKKGMWIYLYENKKIGGGSYDELGQKNGKWRDLSDIYWEYWQVTYDGEYKNGKKIGTWDILFRLCMNEECKQIGGGQYDYKLQGDSIKIGRWVELSDDFYSHSRVTYCGEYRNGKKEGKWDILYINKENNKQQKIGGGLYENNIKIGSWIELISRFSQKRYVKFQGDYKNGRKVDKNLEQIGGGLYDNKVQGKEIKIGKWIELLDWFSWDSQITINGDYLNGKKVGSWNFFLGQIMNLKIGGGTYDFLQEKSIKVGKWKVLNDGFHCQSKVTYHGEYLNNQKAGSWNTYYKRYSKKERIGGGLFDMGIKIGKWIDLDEVFQYDAQIQYIGDYKKGQKVGQWDTYYNNEFQDQRNQKMQITKNPQQWWRNEEIDGNNLGQWIELSDYFNKLQQQNYNGEIYGNQFNSYEIFQSSCNQFKQIGGGLFDEEECGVKIGNWIELIDGFEARQQITYNGKYKNGKKVDGWVKMDIRWNLKLGDLIYDN